MINYCHASPFANERDEQMQHQILQSFRIWRITIAQFLQGLYLLDICRFNPTNHGNCPRRVGSGCLAPTIKALLDSPWYYIIRRKLWTITNYVRIY